MKTSPLAPRIVLTVVMAVVAVTAAAQDREQEYSTAISNGSAALAKRQYEDALKAYKRANGLRDKKSAEAHHGMALAYFGLGAHKSVVDACNETLKYVAGDTLLEARARNLRGTSLFQQADKANDKRLAEAEADFRAVIALGDEIPSAQYNLGVVLLRSHRDEEGIRELRAFIARGGRGVDTEEARRMIENPRRARETYAPDFSLTTIDGRHVTLEDLRGKAVLLDFWGTWCPPCRAATPDLVRLAKKMTDRPFVMIGISSDRDEQVMREYVEKNKMEWLQFFDRRREIHRLFNVNVFPTYVLIDHEGIIRGRKTAYGPDTERWLDSEVKRQVKASETVK